MSHNRLRLDDTVLIPEHTHKHMLLYNRRRRRRPGLPTPPRLERGRAKVTFHPARSGSESA